MLGFAIALLRFCSKISFYPAKSAAVFVPFWPKISFFNQKVNLGIDQKYIENHIPKCS